MLSIRVWMHPRATEFGQNWLTGKLPKDFNAPPHAPVCCDVVFFITVAREYTLESGMLTDNKII